MSDIIIGVKNIEILHEDDYSIIVNKPAGLAVQGGEGVKTSLDKLLCEHFKGDYPPLLVHRLDKDTSGVLLTAKGHEAAGKFSHLLKQAVKLYTAVCCGCPKNNKGIITNELIIRVSKKKSETKYSVIKTGTLKLENENLEYSVLELELGTGRMHQIRRHLAMNGNPILGDDKYGNFPLNKKLRKSNGLKRLLLHASRLIIKSANNSIDITAPLPEYFKQYIV